MTHTYGFLAPDGIAFADLMLGRDPMTKRPRFRKIVFAALCTVNGFGTATTIADSNLAVWIILEWYGAHLAAGGRRERVAERMLKKFDAFNSAPIRHDSCGPAPARALAQATAESAMRRRLPQPDKSLELRRQIR